MALPFTLTQFFEVFERYNRAVWPMQGLLLALAVAGVLLVHTRWERRSQAVCWILAGLWVWTGLAYHVAHFAAVNPVARLFGALCVAQGALFAWLGANGARLRFDRPSGVPGLVAWTLIAFAIAVYPLLGWLAGHRYMASPTFGAPCPTTIFTFGMLWLGRPPLPRYALAVPLAWSAVGGSAAFALGVRQDLGLVAAGASGLCLLFVRRWKP